MHTYVLFYINVSKSQFYNYGCKKVIFRVCIKFLILSLYIFILIFRSIGILEVSKIILRIEFDVKLKFGVINRDFTIHSIQFCLL